MCYIAGALILTSRGEVPAVGDALLTPEGEARTSFMMAAGGMFHNAQEFAARYPDAGLNYRYCAPRG